MIQRKYFGAIVVGACVALATACSSTPQPPADNGGIFRQRNEGYSLLYKLMSDESDVGKIFILKHADDSVGNLVREVGKTCQAAKKRLDELKKTDSRLDFAVADLPAIEQKSRDLQAKEDEHALLFTSGKEFERRLIFTQAQAMNYAVQLSRALESDEDDADHKKFLTDLAGHCTDLHDRLVNLLTVQP